MAEFDLQGMTSMLAKFDAIKQEVKYKSGRASLRKTANFIAGKAKEGARTFDDPETGRSIADNIAVRWNGKLFKATGDLGFRVGVLGGAKLSNGGDLSAKAPTPHWRLKEYGTEKMPAQPFMRPAIENNVREAITVFAKAMEKSLDAAIRKANRAAK